jgi:hypothetical protein
MIHRLCAVPLILLSMALLLGCSPSESDSSLPQAGQDLGLRDWIGHPMDQWPQVAMINNIEYEDKHFEVAGCGFLLDWEGEIYAVTAKHVLTYFKSQEMDSVYFQDTLKQWKMYPKDNPEDFVLLEELINEDAGESLAKVPPERDWLLFRVKERSARIQPLKFRITPVSPGEKIYILGWRYTDNDCTQRIYEGEFVKALEGAVLVDAEALADNTMPGLSGGPVIDGHGDLIGIMCQKSGKLQKAASTDYPRSILEALSD